VGAQFEPSAARGINGNQNDNSLIADAITAHATLGGVRPAAAAHGSAACWNW